MAGILAPPAPPRIFPVARVGYFTSQRSIRGCRHPPRRERPNVAALNPLRFPHRYSNGTNDADIHEAAPSRKRESDVKTNNRVLGGGTQEAVPLIHRVISLGFALCVLASAAVPAFGWSI